MNNRPIKLRFYDKEYSQWRELPDLLADYVSCAFRTYGDGFDVKYFLNSEARTKVKDGTLIIQQFTGLKDSTGKEIYEGDIVAYFPQLNSIEAKCEVVSCVGGFRLARLHSKKGVLLGAFVEVDGKVDSLKVIGNIFETPELLA